MASDKYPLLRRLRDGAFENSLIVTYNADLVFYEQVVLPILRSRGCNNNLVIMDLHQYELSLESAAGALQKLGRQYCVCPVSAPLAFHPKLILLTSEKRGRLVIGSGNLTVRGFSSNWEVFTEADRDEQSTNDALFQQLWRFARSTIGGRGQSIDRQVKQIEETSPWILGNAEPIEWPKLLIARHSERPLAEQIRAILRRERVQKLTFVAAFFDEGLRGLNVLRETLSPGEVALIVQPETVSLSGEALARQKKIVTYRFDGDQSSKSSHAYLHAKVYFIETSNAEYCIWGSPNCTFAALAASGDAGNTETALVTRGKKGRFQSQLGLAGLARTSHEDVAKLTVRHNERPPQQDRLRLESAEVHNGEITVRVSGPLEGPKDLAGRLVLTVQGMSLPQIPVRRRGVAILRGKWTGILAPRTVFCRLVIGTEGSECSSTQAAVNFCDVLVQNTASRRTANIQRMLHDIKCRSVEWADGLEELCDVLFRIEAHGMAAPVDRAGVRGRKHVEDEGSGAERDYGHFVGQPARDDRHHDSAGMPSSSLVEFVNMLTGRLTIGVETEANDRNDDLWKYQEEIDRESAEKGTSPPPRPSEEDIWEAREKLHSRVRNGYLRLMQRLNARFEEIRDQKIEVHADEFLRLHLVCTLALRATDRALEEAIQLGPVITAEDLNDELLPAVAIFLGRVGSGRGLEHAPDGPLVLKGKLETTDSTIREAADTVQLFLAALVAHRRTRAAKSYMHEEEKDPTWWMSYAEISATRSIAGLQRLGLVREGNEFTNQSGSEVQKSLWLQSIEPKQFLTTFNQLVIAAHRLIAAEEKFRKVKPPAPTSRIAVGDWVYTMISGVTEVDEICGSKVRIAMVGETDDKEVAKAGVWPAGLRRSIKAPSDSGW